MGSVSYASRMYFIEFSKRACKDPYCCALYYEICMIKHFYVSFRHINKNLVFCEEMTCCQVDIIHQFTKISNYSLFSACKVVNRMYCFYEELSSKDFYELLILFTCFLQYIHVNGGIIFVVYFCGLLMSGVLLLLIIVLLNCLVLVETLAVLNLY